MKTLNISYLESLNTAASIEEATEKLSHSLIAFEEIGEINWQSQFTYKPSVKFKIARSKDSLYIWFAVDEEHVRAINTKDQEPVWEDSCVEFFCKLPEWPFYRHFEFNCIGTCVAYIREGKDKNLQPFTDPQLKLIERYAGLGNQPFEEKHQPTHWELCVRIPFVLLDINPKQLPEKLMANFYKCGDNTAVPHYLSWNRIQTETPDFHRPDFFGICKFL